MSCSVVSWSAATSEPPKVVRTPGVFNILTWKCASRHNGVHFFGEHVVFCTFWLRNVLRATTACTFSTSEPPKVARTCGVLYILTWKCASRHNGVHFFDISTSKSVLRATTACTFSTSQLPKVVQSWCVLYILTWKCASRHNGVHFFDIATSKSGPKLVCFVHFDFKMCFAPQRRALFWHLNFQKWSGAGVFCTFWLGNLLRATTACNFSSLIWPAGSAPNHWKNTVFRDFPTFSRIFIFFLLTLSLLLFFLLIFLFSLPLPCSAFHLSILSEVWLLNFLRLWMYIYIYIWNKTYWPPFHFSLTIAKKIKRNTNDTVSWWYLWHNTSSLFSQQSAVAAGASNNHPINQPHLGLVCVIPKGDTPNDKPNLS